MARSLNRVELIGNLTRDPEMRVTPQGTSVTTFSIATNRTWVTESGEKREDTEFHRIVAWQKLAELCTQLLTKGRKVYVEGRMQTRKWVANTGEQKQITEIVINDMLILDTRKNDAEIAETPEGEPVVTPTEEVTENMFDEPEEKPAEKSTKKTAKQVEESVNPDDIPF